MTSETRVDADSIPPGGISAQVLLTEAVGSCPVRVHAYGVSVSSEVSVVERAALIVRLLDGESRVSCPFRLAIGDVWNQTPPRTEARKELAVRLRVRFGPHYYGMIRKYGSVASKWPQRLRGGTHNWSYYEKGPDGKGCARSREMVHQCVRREVVDGCEVLHCERSDGTPYLVRVMEKVKP